MPDDRPIMEIAEMADKQIGKGFAIWQKWTCGHCGARQTMDVPNVLYTSGRCQECDEVTPIEVCGFMAASTNAALLVQRSIDAT